MKNLLNSHHTKLVLLLMIPLVLIFIGVLTFKTLKDDKIKEVQIDCISELSKREANLDSLVAIIDSLSIPVNEIAAIVQFTEAVTSAIKNMERASEHPGTSIPVFKSKLARLEGACRLKKPSPEHSALTTLVDFILEYLNFTKIQYESNGEQLIQYGNDLITENLYVATLEKLLVEAQKERDEAEKEVAEMKLALETYQGLQASKNESTPNGLDSECDHSECIKNQEAELVALRRDLDAANLIFMNQVIEDIREVKDITNPTWEAKEFRKIEALLSKVVSKRDKLSVEVNKLLQESR